MPRASHATTREPHYHSASERGVADLNSVEFANDVVRLALDGADGGDAATTWRDSGFTAAPLSTVMHRRQDDEAASRIVDFRGSSRRPHRPPHCTRYRNGKGSWSRYARGSSWRGWST